MSYVARNSSTYMMLLVLIPSTVAIACAESVDSDTSISEVSTVDKPAAKELSVAPLDHIEYPDDRPSWVDQSIGFDKDSVRIVVVSRPGDTPQESLEDLKVMQRAAVSTYIAELAESDGRHDFYRISDDEIDDELVMRRYEGKVKQGDLTRYEHAVELGFTQEKRREIVAAWKNLEIRDRLGALGVVTFGGLFVLVCNSLFLGMVTRRVDARQVDRGQQP